MKTKRYLFIVAIFIALSGSPLFLPSKVMANVTATAELCCKRKPTAAEKRNAEIKRIAMVRAANKAAAERRVRLARERAERLEKDEALAEIQNQDPFVRESAINGLGSWNGTVLVTDIATHNVVASVYQDWANYKEFHPCSTIKLPTAVAGIEGNVIDSNGLIVGKVPFKKLETMTLDIAIGFSDNDYFNTVGAKVGGRSFLAAAQKLRLGQKSGFNVPGQSLGRLPSVVSRDNEYSHGYDVRVTALQLNEIAMAVANSRTQDSLGIPKEELQRLIPGMILAAESGTARLSKSKEYDLRLAGKTGTCQSTGLFTGFAPHDNPKYAITVIIRGGGGKYAAEIAGKTLKPLKDSGLFNPPPKKAEDQKSDRTAILQ